jgi:hypothetical protein
VRVTQRKAGAMPTLEEARAAVEREWMNARRQDVESRRLEDLLKKYEVVIEPPATSGAP